MQLVSSGYLKILRATLNTASSHHQNVHMKLHRHRKACIMMLVIVRATDAGQQAWHQHLFMLYKRYGLAVNQLLTSSLQATVLNSQQYGA